MRILHSTEALRGFSVVAADGRLGHVTDAYFDDSRWVIRHLLVDTESTLPHRDVLISPSSLLAADWARRTLSIGSTRQEVRSGTAIKAMWQAMAPKHARREPQLLRCEKVIGCDVQTSDDPIGHIDDLLFDERHWKIESMVVDTRNWWPGKRIVISPSRIVRASWAAMIVIVNVMREQFETEGCGIVDFRVAV